MSKKIKIIILIAVAVLVITVVSIVILINSKGYKDTLVKSDLRSLSEEFYSYYYDENNTGNNAKTYLAQFKDSGLTITLSDLKIFLESRTEKKYDYKNLEKCNIAKTKVKIIPKEPYGKKDFDLEFKLSCE